MTSRRVAALADAVTDGERVDWRHASSRLSSSRNRALAAQLKTLSEISPPSERSPIDAFTRRGVPLILAMATLLASAIAMLGIVGMVSGTELLGRDVLRLLIVSAYAATGLLLVWGARHPGAAALGGAYWSIAASFAVEGTGQFFHAITGGTTSGVLDALRPEAFLGAFFWQFAREFPVARRFGGIDRFCRHAFRVSLLLGAVLFVANVLPAVTTALPFNAWVKPLDRLSGNGDWFWAVVFATTLPALVALPLRARDATARERRRVRAFLFGIAIGLGPVTVEVLAEALIPGVALVMNAPIGRAWGAWLIYPPILMMPVMTAYVVTVHDVLSVRVAVRQGFRHLLARWLVTSGTAGGLLILITYIYSRRDHSVANVLATPRAQVLLVVIATGALLVVFRGSLIRALDRWVAPGADEPATMLALLSEQLRMCRTPMELASAFAKACERALQTSADVHILGDDERLTPVSADVPRAPDTSLVPLLARGADGPCVLEPGHAASYYHLVSAGDRRWIDAARIGVIVPLSVGRAQKRLFAVVTLQSRRTAQAFSADLLRFVTTAAASVSFAAEALHGIPSTPADECDELAIQCNQCGRIDAWRPEAGRCPCGGLYTPSALPKTLFNRFDLEAVLGSGGMGVVYLAMDSELHRRVAIKTLPTLTMAAADRLMSEARIMAALSHGHIAVLYGTGTWQQTPVLMMEYLSGGTLATRVKEGPVSLAAAVHMTSDLATALEHVHRAGWYHGDIKPSNIGFTESGSPKFLDFGLSRASEGGPTALAGTLPYLSPEVLTGEPAGPVLDLWALSVVLFETVVGIHPFLDGQRTAARIARGLDRAFAVRSTSVPPEVWSFFAEALASDPSRRPRSASDLLRRLTALAEGTA